jgi:hypothetical protein
MVPTAISFAFCLCRSDSYYNRWSLSICHRYLSAGHHLKIEMQPLTYCMSIRLYFLWMVCSFFVVCKMLHLWSNFLMMNIHNKCLEISGLSEILNWWMRMQGRILFLISFTVSTERTHKISHLWAHWKYLSNLTIRRSLGEVYLFHYLMNLSYFYSIYYLYLY